MNPRHQRDHNPDHDLDRVLDALRTVAPPEGMQQRLHETMRSHEATSALTPRTNRERFRVWKIGRFAPPALFASSLAAAVVLGVLLFGVHGLVSHPPAPAVSVRTDEQRSVRTEARLATLTTSAPLGSTRGVHRSKVRQEHNQRAFAHQRLALSYPAPEAPLTKQEKLLQGIARTGGEQEFAMLNPEMRASKADKDRADFRRFLELNETAKNNEIN